MCVCGQKFLNEAMVPTKLRIHVITNHSNLQTETMVYFQRLLQANSRQRKLFQKAMTVSERAQLASYEVAKMIGFKSSLMSLRNQWFFQCCDRKSRVACAQSLAPWQQATIEFMRCNLSYCIESLTKTPMVYSVLYFYLGELGTLLGGAKPTKAPPVATGLQQGCREIFTVLKTVSPCKNVWEPLVYTIRLTTCL